MASLDKVISELERRKRMLVSELAKAEAKTIGEALEHARSLSSGGHSTAKLRRIARLRGAGVYSRRNPDSRFDPGIINAQTGSFRSDWFTVGHVGSRSIRNTLVNNNRVADFMKGTRRMRERPIITKIIARLEPGREKRIRAAIEKVCK